MITVHIIDSQQIYVRSEQVDPYMRLPDGAITGDAPPVVSPPQVAQWSGNGWTILPERPAPPAPSIEELRAQVQQAVTDKRLEVMTGGLTLPGGIEVGTTIDDQNRITSVVANAALAGLTDADEVDFKATSGWVRITIGQVKTIAGAIGQFVQACYTAERTHHEAIDLLATAQELHAYDVNAGWPANGPSEP